MLKSEGMSGEEIERLLKAAPPGTRFAIITITVPEGPATVASPLGAEAGPEQEWTPRAVVEWVRREHGPSGLKLKQWAAMPLGVSMRELTRAARDGRLACREKEDGRDHGARMASPDAIIAFLEAEGLVTTEPLEDK